MFCWLPELQFWLESKLTWEILVFQYDKWVLMFPIHMFDSF
jgi:hypothetical protein